MSGSFSSVITISSRGQGEVGSCCQYPHVQLLQKGATKPCPLPAGCLPAPRQWKEIPPRGVPLPAPRLEGGQGTAGCPPPGALAMGLVSISLALFLPHDSWVPVGMGWGLTRGWGRVPSPGLLLGIFYWLVFRDRDYNPLGDRDYPDAPSNRGCSSDPV